MTVKNRKLIIKTCAGTFPKVQADRLPANVTGEELKTELEKLFDEKGFLISNQRLGHLIGRAGKESKVADILCALWWSVTANANPYKMDIGTMMLWSVGLKEMFQAIDKLLEPVSQFMAHLEKDRANLSAMGAW